MKNFAPESIVAIMLTVGVVIFMLALTIKSLVSDATLDAGRVEILDSILTSMIAIISVYVGSKLNNKN